MAYRITNILLDYPQEKIRYMLAYELEMITKTLNVG